MNIWPLTVSVESFINALDKDGDGEIGQEEAKKVCSWKEMLSTLNRRHRSI